MFSWLISGSVPAWPAREGQSTGGVTSLLSTALDCLLREAGGAAESLARRIDQWSLLVLALLYGVFNILYWPIVLLNFKL